MEFRRHDLTHDDIEGRNIICPNGVLNEGVFIDFGSAQDIPHCPHRVSDGVHIWILLVTILGWVGAQTWIQLKADQSITDAEWREVLLEIRNSDEWTPFTNREWEIAEMDDRRNEEAREICR
jgi:hypothetical protein